MLKAVFCFALLLSCLLSSKAVLAGDSDRYRYVLEQGTADVSRHMGVVFNRQFDYPWKRPALTNLRDDPAYGPTSPYAFEKRPGVAHDSRMTLQMSFSALPTSTEFDEIQWREGRIDLKAPVGEGPALVAVFDIDNDGHPELVVKSAFMHAYHPGNGSGGEDMLFIFRSKENNLPSPVHWQAFLERNKPALIALSPYAPYRLIRPFRYEGTTYLAGYEQRLGRNGKPARERLDILIYRGGGLPVRPGTRTALAIRRVCRFGMRTL